MSFLPIAGRELAVAARRPATHWLRLASAFLAMVVAGGFIGFSNLSMTGGSITGQALFQTLTWLALPAVLASGLFLTADCLSEEKRDGTIGLLFLTDLRTHDIVAGKLLATSLRAFEILLACFPMLAIPLLMGGVTGGELARSVLALANALFCSLATGLLVSALSRDSFRAVTGTLLALLIFVFCGPLVDFSRQEFTGAGRIIFSLTSPGYAFVSASSASGGFYRALALSHACGWVLLAGTAMLLPRFWQMKGNDGNWLTRPVFRLVPRKAAGGFAVRRRRLDRDPLAWFFTRDTGHRTSAWVLAVLILGAFGSIAVGTKARGGLFFWATLENLFVFMLYLGAAFQATRSLLEARKGGMLELLLATPASGAEIVRAQWLASLRWFLLPMLALAGANALGTLASQGRLLWGMPGAFTQWEELGMSLLQSLVVLANLSAIAWFGMWTALNSRSSGSAALRTLLWVQVLPWIAIKIVSMSAIPLVAFGMRNGNPTSIARWYALITVLLAVLLSLLKDAGFIAWSRSRLAASFRERVANGGSTMAPRRLSPPAVAPGVMAPPPKLTS